MAEIVFSVAERAHAVVQYLEEKLSGNKTADFPAVKLRNVSVGEWWNELRRAATAQSTLSVSEVGSTWAESLISMNALRPFYQGELAQLGGREMFAPVSHQSMSIVGDGRIWAIPWQMDVRCIFYWRDMLEVAGIDEATAFKSFDALEDTLSQLQASGFATPWVMPTMRANNTLYHLATWMWGTGGDFVDATGKNTRFAEPESLDGIIRYYNLKRYMTPGQRLSDDDAQTAFCERRAAVITRGLWLTTYLQGQLSDEEWNNLGIAMLPGPAFVGGSNLVIWNQTPDHLEDAALSLIAYLVSPEIQRDLCWAFKFLPVRLDVLEDPLFAHDPFYRVLIDALAGGRSLPSIPNWGTLEENLTAAFGDIWDQIIENPGQSVADVVRERMENLAVRLDRTLSFV
jgi:multiple sugar transport system substrate-binding protein